MDGMATAEEAVGLDQSGTDGTGRAVASSDQVDWEAWLTEHSPGVGGEDENGYSAENQSLYPGPLEQDAEARSEQRQPDGELGFIQGWQDSIQQLAELGVTPELLTAELQALRNAAPDDGQVWPHAQATEEEQFTEWLTQREVDPDECTRAELLSLEGAWRQDQMLAQYQQQMAAAHEQALRAQWQSDLQMVETDFPEFSNPVLRDALLNMYEGRYGIEADYDQLAMVAEELVGTIRQLNQAELARYAQAKQADAMFPVFAGGSAPAPHGTMDFHQLSPTMQQEFLESHFAAAGGA